MNTKYFYMTLKRKYAFLFCTKDVQIHAITADDKPEQRWEKYQVSRDSAESAGNKLHSINTF